MNKKTDLLDERKNKLEENIVDNIDKGEQIFAIYKGQALDRASGKMTDKEALALGHYGGKTNIALNAIKITEVGLNDICSLPPDLVPVKKKTRKGMVWVLDDNEAKQLSDEYQLPISKIEGKWYYEYPGYRIEDYIMAEFVYDVARSSGAFQGETKTNTLSALSNLKAVPIFPANTSMRPDPEHYTNIRETPDND